MGHPPPRRAPGPSGGLLGALLGCGPAGGPAARGPIAADPGPPPGEIVPAPPGAVGFGAALAWGPDGLWVSAPFGEEALLYSIPTDGPARAAWSGPPGAGLHLGPRPDGGLWISAPLRPGGAGVLDLDGAEVRAGPGGGGALIGGPPGLVAEGAGVWVEGAGVQDTPYTPASLAASAGGWVAGMRDGALAAWGPEGEVAREGAGEGHQIAVGDFFGDGRPSVILGDPTTGDIRIVDLATGETAARLDGEGPGLTLSAADHNADGVDDLLIGWPFAGADRAGAAALLWGSDGGLVPAARWRGAEPGGWLGAAVALAPGQIAVGAPGGRGRVSVHPTGLSAASSGTAPSRR